MNYTLDYNKEDISLPEFLKITETQIGDTREVIKWVLDTPLN